MGRGSTGTPARPRDADTKLAQSRLSVLELARELVTSRRRAGSAALTGPASMSGSGGSRRRASRA